VSLPKDYSGVVVCAPVSTERPRTTRHGVPWFMGNVLSELVRRSGISKSDITGLAVASYGLAPDNAASLSEYFRIEPTFVLDIPYGGASGVIAMSRAARAIQAGDTEVVACLAADIAPSGYGIYSNFSGATLNHVYPYGAGGANATFALITANYIRTHNAPPESFGAICVAQRANGMRHPLSLFRAPLTMDEYLASRTISDPLRLFDCVPRCCAGEGFLAMTEDRARSLGLSFVRIAGVVERNNGFSGEPIMSRVGIARDRERLYAQAGLGPDDIDFVQAYDDYPVIVMMQLEALGFCREGEAHRLVREKRLTMDGDLPLNTSGGMLSLGQPGAAGGFLGMNEAIRQLTGEVLGGRVPDASVGVVSCYGTVNFDRGICSNAAILTAGTLQ
jgi:acetyl-CoA acetyltransferase